VWEHFAGETPALQGFISPHLWNIADKPNTMSVKTTIAGHSILAARASGWANPGWRLVSTA
jgi:hypothetical protein